MQRLIFVVVALFAGVSHAALTQITGFGSNPGSLTLWVYEPAGVGTNPPLVVAMHGCTQTAAQYEAAGWNALADQYHFIVAYPQTTASNGCFDWFNSAQQSRTGGQVTSILQMVTHLQTTKGVDPARVFVTGLSAGGAMTNVLLATASDVFSRGAVMAGIGFGCSTNQTNALTCMSGPPDKTPAQWGALVRAAAGTRPAPRVSLWHGEVDGTVAFTNLAEQRDQWVDVNGIDATADATTTVGRGTHVEYKDGAGNTLVETWSVSNMNHGAALDATHGCGTASAYMLDVGLCSSRYAAQFFGLIPPGTGGGAGGGSGGGAGTGGGTSGSCSEFFDTNVAHFTAGRAVLCAGHYCAKGSNELLGDSLEQTWVKQTAAVMFYAGRCTTTGAGGGTAGTGGGMSGSGGGVEAAGGGSGITDPMPSGGCGCGSGAGLPLVLLALALRRRRAGRAGGRAMS